MMQDLPTAPGDADHPAALTGFVAQLDARQRAMLAEMGVRVWAPAADAASAAPAEPPVVQAAAVATATPPAAPSAVPTAAAPAAVARSLARPAAAPVRPDAPPPAALPLGQRPAGIEHMDASALCAAVGSCEACGLCRSRSHTVFGQGDLSATWLVVGEAPNEAEDLDGQPFVGMEGRLLDNMLRAVGRSRSGAGAQGAYLTPALKCRPPASRGPLPAEVAQCEPYLARQVALQQPRVILAMGRLAALSLLNTTEPLGQLRGRVHRYQGVPLIVTFHPTFLLRYPKEKAKAWDDLCLAMDTDAASA